MKSLSLFLAFAFCAAVDIKHQALHLSQFTQQLLGIGAVLAFLVLIEHVNHNRED